MTLSLHALTRCFEIVFIVGLLVGIVSRRWELVTVCVASGLAVVACHFVLSSQPVPRPCTSPPLPPPEAEAPPEVEAPPEAEADGPQAQQEEDLRSAVRVGPAQGTGQVLTDDARMAFAASSLGLRCVR